MRPAKQGDTVRVHYRGKLQNGSIFDQTFDHEPLRFTIGEGEVISGFEEAVVGMKPGDSKTTELPVEKAFGPYLEERVIEVPKNKFARWDQQPGQRSSHTIPLRTIFRPRGCRLITCSKTVGITFLSMIPSEI